MIYIDDIVVYVSNEVEHAEHLRLVLERMEKHGLKLMSSKWAFGLCWDTS